MRVHELAKELGVKSKDLLDALEEMGYGGRTASSSVPDETVARLRASGGKAVPGAKPRQIEVEQLPAKRPAKTAEPEPAEVEVPPTSAEGNGQVAAAEEIVAAEVEAAPPVPEAGLPALKISRGATPQEVAEKVGRSPAEVVKVLFG